MSKCWRQIWAYRYYKYLYIYTHACFKIYSIIQIKKLKKRFCVDDWKRIHPQAEAKKTASTNKDLRKPNIPTSPQHPSMMIVSEDGLDMSNETSMILDL